MIGTAPWPMIISPPHPAAMPRGLGCSPRAAIATRCRRGESAASDGGVKERKRMALQRDRGLYDPRNEHDACGVGFVANIKGRKSHDIIERGLQILVNLDHRGAVGADPLMGDGAGVLIQMPDALLRDWAESRGIELPPPGRYAVAMCFLPVDRKARHVAIEHVAAFLRA